MKKRFYLTDEEATQLGLKINKRASNRTKSQYSISQEQYDSLGESKTQDTIPNMKEAPVLSAWNYGTGKMMDIEEYCNYYNLPFQDVLSYKLVSHTGIPYYNTLFKDNFHQEAAALDWEESFRKVVERFASNSVPDVAPYSIMKPTADFDTLTYTDVHVGMDTDKEGKAMYAVEWNREQLFKTMQLMLQKVVDNQKSNTLIVDDLGDLMDGYNGYTTRGGHKLPQNMTDEEAFDAALDFKIALYIELSKFYDNIHFNNICNDNHAGAFGYMVNKAFKKYVEGTCECGRVTVENHKSFINHYFMGDVCFVITHGKDDSTLKFGFKPHMDAKQIEKIDQYLKHNGIYNKAKRIIFKKGDSHLCLFDLCSSDDFDYFNYPALSPSSQWVQNNFKKGRRGFVLESFDGIESSTKVHFIK